MASPALLDKMSTQEKEELRYLVDKKAWFKASVISDLSDEELATVEKIRKKKGDRVAKIARNRLYNRHHWDSLRWFLFGGYVDIPGLLSNPHRAYDPEDNPYVKVRVPGWVTTTDEHDQAEPHKLLPDKDYLRLLAYAWVHEPLLVIPKSRQLLVTWLFCGIAAHELTVRSSTLTAWISKKFEDADNHLENRIQSICEYLPSNDFDVAEVKYKEGLLRSPTTKSRIQAMGEEAKGLRQYTFSWVFDDEAAFQAQASGILQAATPTIKGGGRLTLVSSSNGKETFYRVASDNGKIAIPPGK